MSAPSWAFLPSKGVQSQVHPESDVYIHTFNQINQFGKGKTSSFKDLCGGEGRSLYCTEQSLNLREKVFFLSPPPHAQHSLGTKPDSTCHPQSRVQLSLPAWYIGKAQTLRPLFLTRCGSQRCLGTQEAGNSNIHYRPHCFSPGKTQAGPPSQTVFCLP